MKIFLFALALTAYGQNDISFSGKPETNAYITVAHITGTAIDYTCTAAARQAVSTITVTTISNTNPGSATATAHGFYYSAAGVTAKPLVFITGATGNWTPINGLHIVIPTGTGTFTIGVDTSSFGTFSGQSIVVTTRAPLMSNPVWTVKSLVIDAAGNTVYSSFAIDSTVGTAANPSTATTKPGFACAAPASY